MYWMDGDSWSSYAAPHSQNASPMNPKKLHPPPSPSLRGRRARDIPQTLMVSFYKRAECTRVRGALNVHVVHKPQNEQDKDTDGRYLATQRKPKTPANSTMVQCTMHWTPSCQASVMRRYIGESIETLHHIINIAASTSRNDGTVRGETHGAQTGAAVGLTTGRA